MRSGQLQIMPPAGPLGRGYPSREDGMRAGSEPIGNLLRDIVRKNNYTRLYVAECLI